MKQRKRTVQIKRPYQCGIAVYQLAKLRMLEFYYDFLDKYIDRSDFELCYMDTDSVYLVLSGESLEDVVKPELLEEYDKEVGKRLVTDKFSERAPGLFKPEFVGTKDVWLTAKCYLFQNEEEEMYKYSCKGVLKKQNDMCFKRYKDVLDIFQNMSGLQEVDIDKAINKGFRVHD